MTAESAYQGFEICHKTINAGSRTRREGEVHRLNTADLRKGRERFAKPANPSTNLKHNWLNGGANGPCTPQNLQCISFRAKCMPLVTFKKNLKTL